MRDVTEKELNEIMSNKIYLAKCPKCDIGGGDILVRMPWYGKTGACIKCPYCGYETKTYGVSETLFCGKKIASPFTEKALMRGIHKAIQEWNKEVRIDGT